jgi:hypothetical protein
LGKTEVNAGVILFTVEEYIVMLSKYGTVSMNITVFVGKTR